MIYGVEDEGVIKNSGVGDERVCRRGSDEDERVCYFIFCDS